MYIDYRHNDNTAEQFQLLPHLPAHVIVVRVLVLAVLVLQVVVALHVIVLRVVVVVVGVVGDVLEAQLGDGRDVGADLGTAFAHHRLARLDSGHVRVVTNDPSFLRYLQHVLLELIIVLPGVLHHQRHHTLHMVTEPFVLKIMHFKLILNPYFHLKYIFSIIQPLPVSRLTTDGPQRLDVGPGGADVVGLGQLLHQHVDQLWRDSKIHPT